MPAITHGRLRIVELSGDKAPSSFLNFIFINPEKYDWDTYSQILKHEKVHVQQLHSLDILLAELAIVFQWFNPFAWLYRKEIENNLEYLTDNAVLQDTEIDRSSYQLSLVKVSTPHYSLRISTNYNQSLLKKRILMMNAKKSNFHTLWKYFMLLPLFSGLTCVLNEPARGHSLNAGSKNRPSGTAVATATTAPKAVPVNLPDGTDGYWFAAIKADKVYMDLKYNDENHSWSNNSSFPLNSFSALPKESKGDFTLKRDAGTILFNGKFEGDQGYGHYRFSADNEYKIFLKNTGIEAATDQDLLSFLLLDVSKSYIRSLTDAGLTHLNKGQLLSMAVLKVDAPFIKGWQKAGFNGLTPQQLTSAKVLHLDGAYAEEIKKAGYPDVTFQQLTGFKVQGVTGNYIIGLRKAGMPTQQPTASVSSSAVTSSSASASGGYTVTTNLSPSGHAQSVSVSQVSTARVLRIDSAYIKSLAEAGYPNLPFNELTSFRVNNVTADYLKGLQAAGYDHLSARTVISFKVQGVTPAYLKDLNEVGYANLPASTITSFKVQDITADYIRGFQNIGYTGLPANTITTFKMQDISPEYIKSFDNAGFKHLETSRIIGLKVQGVTAAFAKGFRDLGFTNASISDISTMKVVGITPEYIAALKQKGVVAKDLRGYITLKNTLEQ